ncbi:MAG: PRC-barrel domain-containing protein [Candidatus Omnitrophica bacterium]|nr:PRC-barrel domain-containing protein [Candidatus Omnitrophota bacterium]
MLRENSFRIGAFRLIGIGFLSAMMVAGQPTAAAGDQTKDQKPAPEQNVTNPQTGQNQGDVSAQPKTEKEQAQSPMNTDQENHFLSTAKLIGMEVRNQQGETAGKVYDVLIDPKKKSAPMAIVSFGGFLGIGDDLYAIPWNELKHSHDGEACVLNVPKAPESVSSARPDWIALEESFSDEQPKFAQGPYGLKPAKEGDVPTAPTETADLVSANRLMDQDIQVAGSEDRLGGLENLILGSGMGQVACAVITTEVERDYPNPVRVGGPAVGDPAVRADNALEYKDVSIPFTLVEIQNGGKTLTANVSEEEIKQAPEYDNVKRRELGHDREWVRGVYDRFDEDLNQIGRNEGQKAKSIALEK